jgi:hypothetical protein
MERSNAFDEWKDKLVALAHRAEERSIEYRAILGMLLNASRNLDLADCTPGILSAFREVTNILRRPRIIELDVKHARIRLRRENLNLSAILDPSGLSEAP